MVIGAAAGATPNKSLTFPWGFAPLPRDGIVLATLDKGGADGAGFCNAIGGGRGGPGGGGGAATVLVAAAAVIGGGSCDAAPTALAAAAGAADAPAAAGAVFEACVGSVGHSLTPVLARPRAC